MVDGLAAVGASVDDHAIALCESFRASNFSGCRKQVAEEREVTAVAVGEGRDVLTGNHEEVRRRLGVDVKECDALVVLMNRLRGDGSIDDLAEEAVHSGISLQELQERFCGVAFRRGQLCGFMNHPTDE